MTSGDRADRGEDDRAERQLRDWLVDRLVLMGCDPDGVDVDTPFHDLGVGSRDAVVLAGELAEHLGRPVSPVDLWEHPSVAALARFALGRDTGSAATDSAPAARNPDTDARPVTDTDDLIAVVGVGCRFPGGILGPQQYWDFLLAEGDAIGHVDPQRWESFADGTAETDAALARTTTWGGFLNDIDAFDAEFFDISPSEADKMDPQQRLLLEVSHEALENAGIPAESLRHSQTGVFVGACAGEYGFLATADLAEVDNWSGTGGALSVIANRVSYHYDLRGPSITVDTACSSSLVAIHLAVASLRSGESSTALAAGVNVMLSPAITRSFDRNDAMSPSGRCHSFDAAADGYVRSEGCGVVVLKRLADARRDGDHVLAVVRGSAVNSDGHSNGLMAPNPSAQMAVLRAAYISAGIGAREVDYVEAHGTGTLLGDPIEARALGAVAGRGRPADDPLLIGAVKSNLGHLEAAAGIAGFLKVALALEKGCLPATPGFSEPNPHIDFDNLRLKVVAETTPWPTTGRPRRGGVSAFGFGGTNAHLVLEQAPEREALTGPAAESMDSTGRSPKSPIATLVVAGRSRERIATTAGALADWLDGDGAAVPLAEVVDGLDHHRDRARAFATVVATDHAAAITGLRALADGLSAPGVVAAHEQPCRPGTVFVYSGQGSQWVGMARGLLAHDPAFADALEEIEPDFVEQVGFSLIEVVRSGAPVTGIDRIQPVLTGLQLTLTRLWRAHGIVPDAVIGHSMGEAAAAVVAGALSVADGLKVIATRSRLMRRLAGQGAMALIELDAPSAHELVAGFPGVTVAVLASPRQCVIAGPPEQVNAVVDRVAAQDRLARRVEVDVASHHPIIDPVLPDLRAALADLSPRRPHLALLSTTLETGEPTFDADYWCANLRNPVRFASAVARAGVDHGVFVEVSPHPLLTHAIDETLADIHHHAVPTLLRDADEMMTFHTHLNIARTDRRHIPAPAPFGPHPQLPTTPWHHSRHWFATRARSSRSRAASAGLTPRPGTLLGEHIAVGDTTHLWRADLIPEALPYPGHHLLHGLEVVPVSVLVATLGGAAAHLGADGLTDISLRHPIAVDAPRRIHVVADADSVSISSSAITDDTSRRVRHVTARPVSSTPPGLRPGLNSDNGSRPIDTADLVAMTPTSSTADLLAEWGVQGQPFAWEVSRVARSTGRMLADIGLPEPSPAAMLDAAAHVARLVDDSTRDLMVPARIDSVLLPITLRGTRAVLDIRRVLSDDADLVVDIVGSTEDADDALLVRGLRFTLVDAEPGVAESAVVEADPRSLVRTVVWREDVGTDTASPTTIAQSDAVAVLGDAHALAVALARAGVPCRDRAEDARHVIYVAPTTAADPDQLAADHAAAAAGMTSEVTALIARMARNATPQTLWIVTRGVREPNSSGDLPQSALWGLATVMAEEHPDAWGGLIDLAAGADPATAAPLITERLDRPWGDIAALRDGRLLRPSLEPLQTPETRDDTETRGEAAHPTPRDSAALRCRPDAAYLVTGGLGALGRLIAGRLVDHGARRLILVGRTGLPARRDWDRTDLDPILRDRINTVRDLESRGITVTVVALDVADRAAVQAFLGRRDDEGAPPIRGVVHAAGVTENRLLTETDDAALTTVMRPKIAGAQVLHEVFGDSLDFFEMTGSAGVHFGIAGQGGYAAANAYLDALARLRRRTGTPALTIDWVAWQGLGFAVDADIVTAELARRGSRPVTPAEALHAWDLISESGVAQAVVLPPPPSAPHVADSTTSTPLWSQMARPDLLAGLRDGLRTILARELRMSEADLLTDVPFAEFGLNSLMAMSIRRDAEKLSGLELSATMLWNHPTIDALADYLATRIAGDDEPAEQLPAEDSGGLLDDLFADAESAPSPLGAEHGLR